MRYPIVLNTGNGNNYGVTIHDLLGSFPAGDILDETFAGFIA